MDSCEYAEEENLEIAQRIVEARGHDIINDRYDAEDHIDSPALGLASKKWTSSCCQVFSGKQC